jgi:hypothetical protein
MGWWGDGNRRCLLVAGVISCRDVVHLDIHLDNRQAMDGGRGWWDQHIAAVIIDSPIYHAVCDKCH